jgi:transketolase
MSSHASYASLSRLEQRCINTIRFLAVDMIQKANSGHPGLPMGMAGIVFRLFTHHLNFNSANPNWINRDRFLLSAGHGSALLYAMLHLSGYGVTIEDLKRFRQYGSKTPGHPEYGLTEGVEATTGPLGQGIANAVGMAVAARYSASYFNRPAFPLINYRVYVLAGDGCLQEGVSAEACSLAGHLGLSNLTVIFDDNAITIDGSTALSFTEDITKRFEAYGWFVQEIPGDGHDLSAFDEAINRAAAEKDRPSLIKVKSLIGFGSPNKQGSAGVHGSPLGTEEVQLTKRALDWDENPFAVPEDVKGVFQQSAQTGAAAEANWQRLYRNYQQRYPAMAEELATAAQQGLPKGWETELPHFDVSQSIATRVASGRFLEAMMPRLPLVLGGSADLTPSNNTRFSTAKTYQKDTPDGRYIHFGVREHAMGAILNGIALSGLVRAYGATFLCFADYMLPAIRVAALSHYPSIFVFTHDSIGLGEDGPTHQPVEHLSYLRAMPGLILFRPADAHETVMAWRYILTCRSGPVALALTRQELPVIDQSRYGSAAQLAQGGYCLIEKPEAELLLMATGSEVHLILQAAEQLTESGIVVQVVSLPSIDLFEQQTEAYRERVLPSRIQARVAVEAGIGRGWEKYLGSKGRFVGLNRFGASAPAGELFRVFGITVEAVIEAAQACLSEI